MNCRHCGAGLETTFLDLGTAPPSNAYLDRSALAAPELWYPLRLLVCTRCWLVQTEDYTGRETLFDADYAYFSSFSTSWLEHARRYVERMVERLRLDSGSHVVELAANDGYLLQYVRERGIPCFGIEPTRSTAAAARAKGIEIIEEFFGLELARRLAAAGRSADLIVANNVLAHVPDINDFVAGCAELLRAGGVATFEFPHLLQMVRHNQFDTAYHEHFSYLSLTTADRIFARNGLHLFDVEELSTHGGSLRAFACRPGDHARTAAVEALLETERSEGISTPEFYSGFQQAAERVKDELLGFLLQAKESGTGVAAYGAAAKGNTLLNFAGVRADLLPFVVDRNPAKAGKFLPGSRIPIVEEAQLRVHRPEIVLLLPWNLEAEVREQLGYIREWGGRLARAVPRLHVDPSHTPARRHVSSAAGG